MLEEGKISPNDIDRFTLCNSNKEAVDFLRQYYDIAAEESNARETILRMETTEAAMK